MKPQGIVGNLQPMAASAGYPPVTGGYIPPVWLPTSPVAPLPNRDDEFNKNQLEASSTSAFGQGQYAYTHLGNELQYGGNTTVSPTDGSDTSTQLGPHCKQKSVPNDGSLSGNMTVVAINPTYSNQLAVSDNSPVIATMSLTEPGASQAPATADSKFGKTNLNYLKDRLQHKKELTQTMVQTSGAGSPQSTSTNRYYNLPNFSAYTPENPVIIDNPPDRKPMAGP